MKTLVVYFGSKLSRKDFCDDRAREETLRQGLNGLRPHFANIRISQVLNSACSAVCGGSDENIKRLKNFLDSQQIDYAEGEPSAPPFRAA